MERREAEETAGEWGQVPYEVRRESKVMKDLREKHPQIWAKILEIRRREDELRTIAPHLKAMAEATLEVKTRDLSESLSQEGFKVETGYELKEGKKRAYVVADGEVIDLETGAVVGVDSAAPTPFGYVKMPFEPKRLPSWYIGVSQFLDKYRREVDSGQRIPEGSAPSGTPYLAETKKLDLTESAIFEQEVLPADVSYTCTLDAKSFDNLSSAIFHIMNDHPAVFFDIFTSLEGVRKYKCVFDGEVIEGEGFAISHLEKAHMRDGKPKAAVIERAKRYLRPDRVWYIRFGRMFWTPFIAEAKAKARVNVEDAIVYLLKREPFLASFEIAGLLEIPHKRVLTLLSKLSGRPDEVLEQVSSIEEWLPEERVEVEEEIRREKPLPTPRIAVSKAAGTHRGKYALYRALEPYDRRDFIKELHSFVELGKLRLTPEEEREMEKKWKEMDSRRRTQFITYEFPK